MIGDFFCCLNPVEREVMRTTALAFSLTGFTFVQCDVFDVSWLLALKSRDARIAAFMALYSLERTEIELEGINTPVCVLTTSDTAFWASVALYVLTPSGSCGQGCGHKPFP